LKLNIKQINITTKGTYSAFWDIYKLIFVHYLYFVKLTIQN